MAVVFLHHLLVSPRNQAGDQPNGDQNREKPHASSIFADPTPTTKTHRTALGTKGAQAAAKTHEHPFLDQPQAETVAAEFGIGNLTPDAGRI
jgi:hypothetical protein